MIAYHAGHVARFIGERCERIGLAPVTQDVKTLPQSMRGGYLVSRPLQERDRVPGQHAYLGAMRDLEVDLELAVIARRAPTRRGVMAAEWEGLADLVSTAVSAVTDPMRFGTGAGTMTDSELAGGIVEITAGAIDYEELEDAPALAVAKVRLTAWYQRIERHEVA